MVLGRFLARGAALSPIAFDVSAACGKERPPWIAMAAFFNTEPDGYFDSSTIVAASSLPDCAMPRSFWNARSADAVLPPMAPSGVPAL